jgi:hypothetical protein
VPRATAKCCARNAARLPRATGSPHLGDALHPREPGCRSPPRATALRPFLELDAWAGGSIPPCSATDLRQSLVNGSREMAPHPESAAPPQGVPRDPNSPAARAATEVVAPRRKPVGAGPDGSLRVVR